MDTCSRSKHRVAWTWVLVGLQNSRNKTTMAETRGMIQISGRVEHLQLSALTATLPSGPALWDLQISRNLSGIRLYCEVPLDTLFRTLLGSQNAYCHAAQKSYRRDRSENQAPHNGTKKISSPETPGNPPPPINRESISRHSRKSH